jgi:hypothetical protein
MCRPEVLWTCPHILALLHQDVGDILALLPDNLRHLVRRTRIWVNHTYAYGAREKPVVVQHMTTHHHHAWLLWYDLCARVCMCVSLQGMPWILWPAVAVPFTHAISWDNSLLLLLLLLLLCLPIRARDCPDKAMGIEIYNAADFVRMRQHWNGRGGLLLHEFCHMIHQVVLGLENRRVADLYAAARQSGRYARVLRRDWAGQTLDTDTHYGMVNHKEFFAEFSVTYWSQGYRAQDGAEAMDMAACSPPIVAVHVRHRLDQQGMRGVKLLEAPVQGHCNKFYPFTAGQLHAHDPELYRRMAALWEIIAAWRDGGDARDEACCVKACWTPWLTSPKVGPLMATGDTVDL